MDIANNIGPSSTQSRIHATVGFGVLIAGLSDTPAHGLCATRGVALTALVTGLEGGAPAGTTYQWHVQGTGPTSGPIAGATQAAYVPDASLADESAIFCTVSVPGRGSRESGRTTFRQVAPQMLGSLSDEVFDLDTGPQVVATAAAFAGEMLQFSVSGAGAIIDPNTGDVSISTDAEVDGAQIIVTAANSGGSASAGFQVTVEDVSFEDGEAVPFGALTPEGVGGMPLSATAITGGDPDGHWEITGGMLVPSAEGEGRLSGTYPLVFDTGETLDVIIEDDKASARVEELEAVFAGLPASARGLLVQDGDARPLGRIRLAPKVFDSEMVLEPTNWVEAVDPRASLRRFVTPEGQPSGVILGGLTIGGDPSGDRILRMENLTVQGFECQMEAGGLLPDYFQNSAGTLRESDGAYGIIVVERPSRHVTIRQNDVWSRDLREIILADDFRENLSTCRLMRGITTKVFNGLNDHICIEDNYVHDVSRGMGLVATNSFEGQRSRLCGNIVENCYTNFFTSGFLDGLDIFDNLCSGITAANEDTTGDASTRPHAAAGGSFDAASSRTTVNVSMMGNVLNAGSAREVIHAELGLPKPTSAATGAKFNDPQAADSYADIVVAFNLIITRGIALEFSGFDGVDAFNNTLATNPGQSGGAAVLLLNGVGNARVWNNVMAGGLAYGAEDGTSYLVRTMDTLRGYANHHMGPASEFVYFAGHTAKGLGDAANGYLTLDELKDAYTPSVDSVLLSGPQPQGALGTGHYSGEGVHTMIFDHPVSTANETAPTTGVRFNGSTFAKWTGSFGTFFTTGTDEAFVALDVKRIGSATNQMLMDTQSGRMKINLFNNRLQVNFNSSSEARVSLTSRLTLPDDDAFHLMTLGIKGGHVVLTLDGEVETSPQVDLSTSGALSWRSNLVTLFAAYTGGHPDRPTIGLRALYIDNVFHDMLDDAKYAAVHNADGSPRDYGNDGSGWFGTTPGIFLRGDATAFRTNRGYGPQFSWTNAGNLVTDAG